MEILPPRRLRQLIPLSSTPTTHHLRNPGMQLCLLVFSLLLPLPSETSLSRIQAPFPSVILFQRRTSHMAISEQTEWRLHRIHFLLTDGVRLNQVSHLTL